ncbi:MAG: 23S rRNA (uracil(1939)-C(5))-methyltransferase RlmD [Parasporobacterium sp.]|nr:23S rRNA (uracil(1939)-C(5))-methyltransferase RlmD [Parasporobacterium sp.]
MKDRKQDYLNCGLKKNDRIRLKITDMGVGGEGIGKYYESSDGSACGSAAAGAAAREGSGMTFFVKNAVIGDEVLAVITGLKKGYGYAKVLEILQASRDRTEPACPIAQRCGGCQIMQLSYDAQLRFKEQKVRSDLERIGGQVLKDFRPIIGAEDPVPLHFRNKMQFPVGWDREGHVVTGFYAGRTHYIVAASECPVSPEVNTQILETVRQFLEKNRISAYQEETGKGLIRHILIRNGCETGQIMVCLVINGRELQTDDRGRRPDGSAAAALEEQLVCALTSLELPVPWKIAGICLNSNMEQTNVILGPEVRCLYGNPYIEERITSRITGMKPLTFRIGPLSFFQTNTKQTARLYDTALEFAGLTGTETVWDLYCGTGTISLFLAQKAGFVHGVEIVPEAIRDARDNAERNQITNVEFLCGKSEEIFPGAVRSPDRIAESIAATAEADAGKELQRAQAQRSKIPDVVVLDPPRKGCDPALLNAILDVKPSRIVYVSCDPATLARDIKILCSGENACYELKQVQPVDMFPHTVHVETCCLLERLRNAKDHVTIKLDMEDYYKIKDGKKL